MNIRKANLNDLKALVQLSCVTFSDTYAWYNTEENMSNYLAEHFTEEKLQTELVDEKNIFFVIESNEQLIAYLKLSQSTSPQDFSNKQTMELARIYVSKNIHDKGVGKLLLTKAIETAKEINVEILWLGVWQQNKKAIAFYERNGFSIVKPTTFLLGNDLQNDWLMMKPI